MSNVTVVAKYTDTPVPAGPAYSHLEFKLTDGAGAVQTSQIPAGTAPTTMADGSTAYVAVFQNVADGTASVTVTAIAADGSTIGTAASGSGVIVTPTFPQPTVITVS